jgi:hypothetical protein
MTADVHAHVQRLVSVVKMATVLECTVEGQRSVVRFMGKRTMQRMFPVSGGKFLLRKAVQNWVEKFSQGHSKVADYARPGRPVEMRRKQLCSGWKS